MDSDNTASVISVSGYGNADVGDSDACVQSDLQNQLRRSSKSIASNLAKKSPTERNISQSDPTRLYNDKTNQKAQARHSETKMAQGHMIPEEPP